MNAYPIARKAELVVKISGVEILIYDLKTNKAFCLNETSAFVWNLCDGDRSISAIARKMSREMKAPIDEELVWLTLSQLDRENLLARDLEPIEAFTGLSRRALIKKVGLTSVVALPVVNSLVAPRATMAQSGIGLLGQCVAPSGQQGSCNPGLTCFITNTISTAVGTTPTGINQCCTPASNILSGTGCASIPCGSLNPTCGGIVPAPAPPDPNCANFTCSYTS